MRLGVAFLYLIAISEGRRRSNLKSEDSNFMFLIENGEQLLVTDLSETLVSVHLPLEFEGNEIKVAFQEVLAVIAKWENYKVFTEDPETKAEYLGYSTPSALKIANIAANLNELISLQATGTPFVNPTLCKIPLPGIEANYFLQGKANLLKWIDKFGDTWTKETVKTDLGQSATLLGFVELLWDLTSEWERHTSQILDQIEGLESLSIPSSILAELSQSTCLPNLTEGESYNVEKCKMTSLGLLCTLNVYQPSNYNKVIKMERVHYNDINLMGHNPEQTFVKLENSETLKLISCNESKWSKSSFPLCPLLDIPKNCQEALEKEIFKDILEYCNFTKTPTPLAKRLISGSILIQQNDAQISTATRTIRDDTPLVILSPEKVFVKEQAIEQNFPPLDPNGILEIFKSKLTKEDLELLESTYKWRVYLENFTWDMYVRIVLVALQIIIWPLTITTLILGLKQRKRLNQIAKGKAKRKENFEENKRFFQTSN